MNRILLFALGFIFLTVLVTLSCNNNATVEESKAASTEPSLDQKIGQMILMGFRGDHADKGSEIHRLITQRHIGGVVLYNRDVPSRDSLPRNIKSREQLMNLNRQMQEAAATKLIISIDEEGGLVSRLKEANGFMTHASHQAIGELNDVDSTRSWAQAMAMELKELGINMNFGPVVDLNINPDCPAIGKLERSFSADPVVVTANAKIFMEEHRKQKIICVPKHFPGHGSADVDSHQGLTDVTKTWSDVELQPYRDLIKSGHCDIIMTAHVYNAQMDSLPGTLSKKIIDGVLKQDLGWSGIVISDDMQMGAITKHYGLEESVERAILAGVDILLLSNNSYQVAYDPDIAGKTIDHIKTLLADGKITKDRIDESYHKIMEMKKSL